MIKIEGGEKDRVQGTCLVISTDEGGREEGREGYFLVMLFASVQP